MEWAMDGRWLAPAVALAIGVAAGWFIDRVLLVRLGALAARTPWLGDDDLVASLRGIAWSWAVLGAAGYAVQTGPLTDAARSWIVHGLLALAILSVAVLLSRVANAILHRYARRRGLRGHATVVPLLVQAFIYVLAGLLFLQTEGISIAPLLTALGIGGLAVALALQETLGNLFAGIHTLMAGQIGPGDYIRIDERNEGYVVDIGWHNTSLRSPAGNLVVVPNKRLSEAVVTNLTRPDQSMWIGISLFMPFAADQPGIRALLTAVAAASAADADGLRVVRGTPPVVRIAGFVDSSVEWRISFLLTAMEHTDPLRDAFFAAVHESLVQAGLAPARRAGVVEIVGPPGAPPVA